MRFPFESVRDLAPLLGKTHFDPDLVQFADEVPGIVRCAMPTDNRKHSCFWESKKSGLIFGLEWEGQFVTDSTAVRNDVFRLSTIHFVNATKEPGYAAYTGPLLDGLVMGSTQDDATTVLGEPGFLREAGYPYDHSCPMDRWDLGTFNFVLEYNQETLAAELAQITLYPDKMKIA